MSPLAVCQYLETADILVKACFFVSGFANRLPNTPEPLPTLNNPFVDRDVNWDKVRKNCPKFVCFGGDDDPYVPMDILQDFATNLNTKLITINKGGHLNSEFGYTKFPQLLKKIREVCKI